MSGQMGRSKRNGEFERFLVGGPGAGGKDTPEGWVRDALVRWRSEPDAAAWLSGGGQCGASPDQRQQLLADWCEALAAHLGARPREMGRRQCRIGSYRLTTLAQGLKMSLPLDSVKLPPDVAAHWRRAFHAAVWMAAVSPAEVSVFVPYLKPDAVDVALLANALAYAHGEAQGLMSCLRAHPALCDHWVAWVREKLGG